MSHYQLTEEQFHSLLMLHAEFRFQIDMMGTAARSKTETRTVNFNDMGWLFWRWMLLLEDMIQNHPKDDEEEEAFQMTG